MYTISIYKITIYTVSIFLWLLLSPYIVWERNYIYAIFFSLSLLTFVLYISRKSINITSFFLSTIIVLLIFIFMGLNGASMGWSIITSFTIFMILLYSQDDINKIFQIFKLIFALSLIPNIILWIFHIVGIDITSLAIGIHAGPNPFKMLANQHYVIFPGASILNYMLNQPIMRLEGMFDEPGVVGTMAALILTADKINIKNKSNLIIFVAGLMSFSLAFYILMLIYYMLNIKKVYKYIFILVPLLLLIYTFSPQKVQHFITAKTIDRMVITDDFSIKGYNRDNKDSSHWGDWKNSDTKEFLFGLTNFTPDGSSSYKNIFAKTGYIGILLILLIYSFIFIKRKRRIHYHDFIFLFIFILSFIQRPYIVTPYHVLIFIYGLQVSKTKINTPIYEGNQ